MNLGKLSSLAGTVVERFLPWKVAQIFAGSNEKILRKYYDHRVLTTRAYVTGEDYSDFELHMMLGHRHVAMCLWSVKSFLHYGGKKYKIVLHDDGSLTPSDLVVLKEHLLNVHVIEKKFADESVRELLKDYPHSSEFRFTYHETSNHRGAAHNMFIMALILFDYNLLTDAKKIMLLDADVLFFKKPQEITEWIEDRTDTRTLYSVEAFKPYRNDRNELCFGPKIPRTINSGLICFDKGLFDMDAIEKWIGENKELMYESSVFEQLVYAYLINQQEGNEPLPDSYPFNYTDENVVMTHFGIKIRFFQNLNRVQGALS